MLKLTFPCSNGTMRYLNPITPSCPLSGPTLWDPNSLVLSLVVNFFSRSPTQAKVCFASNRRSFKYYASMFLLMCKSKDRHSIINSSYHTYISYIFNPLLYITTYLSWLSTSYGCPSFAVLVWSYH
jgi:hypothetical protein